jgi:hypothetical protein
MKINDWVASAKKTRTKKKENVPSVPFIDNPVENEDVLPGHYAIRISAPNAQTVSVSINDSEWEECRNSVGYFWHDWYPSKIGTHQIKARSDNAKVFSTRTCHVAKLVRGT